MTEVLLRIEIESRQIQQSFFAHFGAEPIQLTALQGHRYGFAAFPPANA
nr:hypothetical protein [Ruficoccus sp. ZRK36]